MAEVKGIVKSEETVTGFVRMPSGFSKEDLPSEIPFIESSSAGEFVYVVETDENGKPTKWGTAIVSFGGGASRPEMGTNYVSYNEQTATEKEQAQARKNIGAVSMEEVLEALPLGEGVRY